MKERQGEKKVEPPDPVIELAVDAYLPETYIRDSGQKVEIYKKIAALRSLEEVDALEEEMKDRFGPLPAPAESLETVRVKILAKHLGIVQSPCSGDMVARLLPGVAWDAERVARLLVGFRGEVRYQPGDHRSSVGRGAGAGQDRPSGPPLGAAKTDFQISVGGRDHKETGVYSSPEGDIKPGSKRLSWV